MSTVQGPGRPVRPAAVAGAFYPGGAAELEKSVRHYLAQVADKGDDAAPAPVAVIAPHAGFQYSGLTAAHVYDRLRPLRNKIKRVVILGPCHRVAVDGLALSGARAFATPLGEVPVDREACEKILALPQVREFDATHEDEHCIEVQLPFLQVILEEFSVVPLVVGSAPPEQVAEVIETLWGDDETLILVSSDLSHYLPYAAARESDDAARDAIERMAPDDIGDDQACGRIPIKGLMLAALRRGLGAVTLDVRNSGDTAGSKDRVVGYGAWMFVPKDGEKNAQAGGKAGAGAGAGGTAIFAAETVQLLKNHGAVLLRVAATSVLNGLRNGHPANIDLAGFPVELRQKGACFVTLEKQGKLRGCIGSLAPQRPLIEDVAENGFRAAFHDRRFEPLTKEDTAGAELAISISVLSPQSPMSFRDQDDLLAQLVPGRDGLVILDGNRRAVFLPVVWDAIPEPEKFLVQLKRKARLAEDHWSPTFQAWRFVTESVSSEHLTDPAALWRLT